MKKIIKNLGIDPGNGNIKLALKNKVTNEHFIYAVLNDFNKENFKTKFSFTDEDIIIGEDALNSGIGTKKFLSSSLKDRYLDNNLYELISMYLSKMFDKYNYIEIEKAVIGVPNNLYLQLNKEVEKIMKNKFKVKKNSKDVIVEFKKIKVVPQPFGTFFSNNEFIEDENVLIVDIGNGTTDITELSNSNVINSHGINTGVRECNNSIKQFIEEAFPSIKLNEKKIENIISTKKIKYGGEYHNIDDKDIQVTKKTVFKDIMNVVVNKYNTLNQFDLVLFTGGGSKYFEVEINNLGLKNIMICKDSQIANAIGYLNICELS